MSARQSIGADRRPRSSVEARFIGGPWDGRVELVPYPPRQRWYVPMKQSTVPTWIPQGGEAAPNFKPRAEYVLWDDWPVRYRYSRVTL